MTNANVVRYTRWFKKWHLHVGVNQQLSNWINLRPTQWGEGDHFASYMKRSQLPGSSDVMDLRKESTTATFLDQHKSLLYSKFYILNSKL